MRSIIWIIGPPGSGKSTVAKATHVALEMRGDRSVILDADDMRKGPMLDLGFSQRDRTENITRLGLFATTLEARDVIPIVAAVTPTRLMQDIALRCQPFLVSLCGRKRDLWPGTSFDAPHDPNLALNTAAVSPDSCAQSILREFDKALE